MPPEPFRDEKHAALARVSDLERQNEELRARLRQKLEPPPTESRSMPLWLLALLVIVPVLLLGTGLVAAFLLRKHDTVVRAAPVLQVGERLG